MRRYARHVMALVGGARRERAIDVGIALVVFAFTLALLLVPEQDARQLDALGVALAGLATLPLVARRRAPLAVFVLTTLASAAVMARGYPAGPPVGPTVSLYFVALSRPALLGSQRLTFGLVVAVGIVHITVFAIREGRFPGPELLLGAPLWGVAWFAGDRTRLRRERMAELEERARRAEREAEQERRLAVAEERTRIARELHDAAGHAINVILVQAGAARLLREQDPKRSREALETIEEVARETLGEIDQLVRALREDGAVEDVEPPPGLAALETLAERHRRAGLDVDVRVHGSSRPLPPGVDRAAYRILQEALTNAARHGDGRADVDVAFGTNALEVTVTNTIAGDQRDSNPGGGHGLGGMRERAVVLGGNLEAEADDGVFRVRASLPYGEEESG